jgi:hypothetical protein
MNDEQLFSLRRDPPPQFAERLRADLRRHESNVTPTLRWWSTGAGVARMAAAVALVAVVAGLFTVPAVRASAQSFLALFRVVNIVAVPVDESRLAILKDRQLDPPHLIGDHVQLLRDPGAPTFVPSPEQAAALAGAEVQLPRELPREMTIKAISVTGEYVAQVTADANRLQQVMDTLGITDLSLPAGLDGQVSTVRVPPVVMVRYEQGPRVTRFYQARTPQVSMPASIDLASLGEIGLRIIGLSPIDANRFSRAINWQTTLLLPVPPMISSFKQVDINGRGGIALERWVPNPTAPQRARVRALLWATDERVFAIESTQSEEDVLLMANSVR